MAEKRKKHIRGAGIVLLAGVLLCGCAGSAEADLRETAKPRQEAPTGTDGADRALQAENGYYYACLDETHRRIYETILHSLTEYETGTAVSCQSEAELQKAFRSVMADHPELFYVTGYTYSRQSNESGETVFVFGGTYSAAKEELETYGELIDEYVRRCFAEMPQGDDYAKVRYLYEYLIRNTGYSLDAPDNQNVLSVFVYGQSVCQGYAKAFQYLCEKAGVRATIVTGKIKKTGYGHSFNLVWADGDAYYVDVTWGDVGYGGERGTLGTENGHMNYDYLCVTQQQIMRTHEIDTDPQMPPCTAEKDNYYVREHVYFTEFDETLLEEAFARAEGGYITFACGREDVFRRYEEYLIGQERVFDYMSGPQGIAYCVNDDMLSFAFWLPHN